MGHNSMRKKKIKQFYQKRLKKPKISPLNAPGMLQDRVQGGKCRSQWLDKGKV